MRYERNSNNVESFTPLEIHRRLLARYTMTLKQSIGEALAETCTSGFEFNRDDIVAARQRSTAHPTRNTMLLRVWYLKLLHSLHLTPSASYFLPKLKRILRGIRFKSNRQNSSLAKWENFSFFGKYIHIVRNFEWLSVYDTDRPIPFFRKFRNTCPPRAVNLMTPRPCKNPREKPSRKDTMDRRNPMVGRENQQRRRTVHHRTSYRAGEILHCQQDLTTAVFITSHFTFI